MQSRSRAALTMIFLAAPLLLLLRSSDSPAQDAGDAQDKQEPRAAATVHATDTPAFDPPEIRVPLGSSVTWKNSSSMIHTVTADPTLAQNPADALLPEGAEPWDSGDLRPGQTFTRKFDVAGTYRYFCKPHESNGMVGTIVVE